MSRSWQKRSPRPEPEGIDATEDSPQDDADSEQKSTNKTDLQEKPRVPVSGREPVSGRVPVLPEPEQAGACAAAAAAVDGGAAAGSDIDPLVATFDRFRCRDFQKTYHKSTPLNVCPSSPLPCFSWAESSDVWENMLKKETTYQRDPVYFTYHSQLSPKMRAILFDWLSEVCELHLLHKQTYCLALDYVDRYLSVTKDVPKEQLQLVGVSALLLASKLEEIYPPKLVDYAYMTDGACTEQDIIRQEMIMVKALKWDLTPMTTNAWLGVYLQVANAEYFTDDHLGFVFPQFSAHAFVQLSRLCDLCLLDYGSMHFRYSILAAAALYHHTGEHLVEEITGFKWKDIYCCVKWMAPFARAMLEVGQTSVKFFKKVKTEDCHNIQTHNVGLKLLGSALHHQVDYRERERLVSGSVDLSASLVSLLMPPDSDDDESTNVSMDDDDDEEEKAVCSSN